MRSLAPLIVVVLSVLSACGDDDSMPPSDAGGPACTASDECDDGLYCNGVETCSGGHCMAAPTGPCLTGQTCDEAASHCTTDCAVAEDADGDGVASEDCGGADCDDSDRDRYPDNPEICDVDGHDEDCDPTHVWRPRHRRRRRSRRALLQRDDVRPGLQRPAAWDEPTLTEVCNGSTTTATGIIDEGVQVDSWPDTDFDLHGDMDAAPEMQCAGAHGYASLGDDCDDSDPHVHPAQVEICDRKDNDCDGTVDEAPAPTTWWLDADDDGFGVPDPSTSRVSCIPLPGYSLRPTDCDDTNAMIEPRRRGALRRSRRQLQRPRRLPRGPRRLRG